MKKLSLKSLNFGANDLLNRQELKTVFGGYGGNCAVLCNSGAYIRNAPNCNGSTQNHACTNQGGTSGACGGGYGC